ncbi:MAG: nuclear transport factor 2 family protein [Actinocatenispora sp.]
MPADNLTPTEVFHRLVQGVSDKRWDELPALYAQDTLVEHPFDPRRAAPLRGRSQLAEHFRAAAQGGATGVDFQPRNVVVHQTTDPEVVIGEFEYHGTARHGAEPLSVRNIFVLRVRDGQIVSSRDYADHLGFARARGDLGALFAELAGRGA